MRWNESHADLRVNHEQLIKTSSGSDVCASTGVALDHACRFWESSSTSVSDFAKSRSTQRADCFISHAWSEYMDGKAAWEVWGHQATNPKSCRLQIGRTWGKLFYLQLEIFWLIVGLLCLEFVKVLIRRTFLL